MRWLELSLRVGADEVPPLVSLLEQYAPGGVVVEEWLDESVYVVKVFLAAGRSTADLRSQITQAAASIDERYRDRLTGRPMEQADWFRSIREQFSIVEVGHKLTIKASWAPAPSPSDRKIIELDPGYAFGTGLHPTTRLCLIQLESKLTPGMKLLDVGTGSGILAIAAAKLGASAVLAVDTDSNAAYAAKNNVQANSVDGIVQVKRGTLSLRRQTKLKGSFDLVLANITAPVITSLADGFWKVLKQGGILVVSGINSAGLDEVLVDFAIAGFKLDAIHPEGEWYAVVAHKP